MAPVYGRDGFSDCKMICDPKNGYSQKTCHDECKGRYNYTTRGINLLTSLIPSTTMSDIIDDANTAISPEPNDEDGTSGMIYVMITLILICFAIAILLVCFRKRIYNDLQTMLLWTRNKLCQIGNERGKNALQMDNIRASQAFERNALQMNNLKESQAFLNKPKPNNTGETRRHGEVISDISDTNPLRTVRQNPENAQQTLDSDTIINVESFTSQIANTRSQHYADEEYHKISHDSFGYIGESISEPANDPGSDTDDDSINPSDSPFDGAIQIAKNKGTVRVITEIKIR